MIVSPTKTLLIIVIAIAFLSCRGQEKAERKQAGAEAMQIGKVVSELDNQIWKILQDSKGRYWFGSNGRGVYCLDGNELRQFTTSDGLVSDAIRGIQEDKDGNVYIETFDGISRFDGSQFTALKAIRSSYDQWRLEPDDLWFGFYNANDLYRYDGDSLFELRLPRKDLKAAFGIDTSISPFDSNNPYSVYGINKDRDGTIWFGTFVAGAFRYDGKSFLWFDEKELSILPDGTAAGVRSIIQDRDGYFWLSNFKSKYKIDSGNVSYEKFSGIEKGKPNYFNSGLVDKDGDLWMTTYGGGVWRYDGKTLTGLSVKKGAENVLLVSIYQDNRGTMWLGTDNDGVYKQHGDAFKRFEPSKE